MDFKNINKIIKNICTRKKGNTIFSVFQSAIDPTITITLLFTPSTLTHIHIWQGDKCVGNGMIHQRKLLKYIYSFYWTPLMVVIILNNSKHYMFMEPSELFRHGTLSDTTMFNYNYTVWSYNRDGPYYLNKWIRSVYTIKRFLKTIHYQKFKRKQKRLHHELSLLPARVSSGFPGGSIYRTAMSEFEASANEMELYLV